MNWTEQLAKHTVLPYHAWSVEHIFLPAARHTGCGRAVSEAIFHLASPLGIDPYNDGAGLFIEACETLAAALFIVAVRRAGLPALGRPPAADRPALGGWLRRVPALG